MGTPTMPPKGVIKARAQARVGALCAMIHVATPSPKAAQRAEQQSAKKDWMKDDEDMEKLAQEKKDLDVPKLEARIRQLEGQLKAKAKKRKSREGQIHQRAKFAELNKQSKNSENQPPASQKRQKVVG